MKAFNLPLEQAEREYERKEGWIDFCFELKYDGTRSFWNRDRLISERNIDITKKFEHIANQLKGIDVILDGEIYIEENSSVFDVSSKENWDKAHYVVFDILQFQDLDFRDLTLQKRQILVKSLCNMLGSESIHPPKTWFDFKTAWDYVLEHKLEGLIAKNLFSKYIRTENLLDTTRSRSWLKIKFKKEAVVIFDKFEKHKDEEGITLTDGFHRVSVRGDDVGKLIGEIMRSGKVKAEVEYLRKTDDGHFFQPVYKRLV